MAKKVNHPNPPVVSIPQIIAAYNQHEYHSLRLQLQMYSLADPQGLLTGYTPYIMHNGQVIKLWCCGVFPIGITINNLIRPFTGPHSHQWWMTGRTGYINSKTALLRQVNFTGQTFTDFEALYQYISGLGVAKGELHLYDLALRVGHCLGIYPQKYVYLHCGSLAGATILRDKGYITLTSGWSVKVPISVFASVFPSIGAMDIENLLCTCKKQLAGLP